MATRYLLLFSSFVVASYAFQASTSSLATAMTRSQTIHNMVKFDGDQWVAESEEESTNAYPVINTLLRHGPKPFLTRVFQPNDYEQAVLKFMAGDDVNRREAQGNMDAYLNNPQDWGYNRLEEERKGVKYDYVTISPKSVILVLVWSTIVGLFVGRGIYSLATGDEFNEPINTFMANL